MKKRQKSAYVYEGAKGDPLTMRLLKDRSVSIVVKDFHNVDWHKRTKVFPIFTIFKDPTDFPGKYVVRLFDGKQPTRLIAVKDTLEDARATIPKIFYRVPRSERDNPVVVETWL
jgi:hypothetical protein